MAKAMLNSSKLPKGFWAEAISTATYIQNRLPSKSIEKTPYELWNGHKPNLSHLKIFGCKAFCYIDKSKRRKLDNRAELGTFVGYDFKSKGYRIYTGGNKITISRSVKFIENEQVDHVEFNENNDPNSDLFEFNLKDRNIENNDDDDNVSINSDKTTEEDQIDQNIVPAEPIRTSSRINKGVPPDRFCFLTDSNYDHMKEPENFNDIQIMPKEIKEKWLKAMHDELDSLKENNTYELVDLPPGKKAIKNKWTFKIKRDEKGKITKLKSRLVAKGFLQKYKIDYDQTFAPVVKHATIRTFIANAAIKKNKIYQLDVKTAFLYANLDEELYMEQPEGFIDPENKHKVCKLKKSIYGLKQAARCWNLEIEKTLIQLGFTKSKADSCLYFKNKNNKQINLILYVDDILITSEDENEIFEIIDQLKTKYEITFLGEVKHFLGTEITRKENGSYILSQKTKIEELIKNNKLENASPTNTPLESNYFSCEKDENLLPTNDEYRSAIGTLLYISGISRPDITVATHILSRRNNNPRQMDWNCVKRIIRYLKSTIDYNFEISSNPSTDLTLYSDADWGTDPNDRKSTTGYAIFLGKSLISWGSKKQPTVSLSSAEAEYIALSQSTQELLWLLDLCKDLQLTQNFPIQVFEDNQSTIKLAQNEKYSARTKHIEIKHHFIRDLSSKGIINISYLQTSEMIADILTKPLPRPQFQFLRSKLNLVQVQAHRIEAQLSPGSSAKRGRC